MISVKDLIIWASNHAIGKSATVPNGWVSATDLSDLAKLVKKNSPLNTDIDQFGEAIDIKKAQKASE